MDESNAPLPRTTTGPSPRSSSGDASSGSARIAFTPFSAMHPSAWRFCLPTRTSHRSENPSDNRRNAFKSSGSRSGQFDVSHACSAVLATASRFVKCRSHTAG